MSKLCLFLIAFYFYSCGTDDDDKKTPTKSSAKDITAFTFAAASNSALSTNVKGTISGANIALTVPANTDVKALVATFSLSAKAKAQVGSTVQTSGTTANDFTNAVTYTVTAEDGTKKTYTVTVTVGTTNASSAKEITEFKFEKSNNSNLANDITGTINGTNIAITVPANTDVKALKASFTVSTKATAQVGSQAQTSGTTANDFSSPVKYVVTAEDKTTQTYTVSVTVAAASSEKDITAFSFSAAPNSALSNDVTGTISGTNIALTVPANTDVKALVANFTLSPNATARVGSTVQTSNTTANDFSSPVKYVVTAEDKSTKTYTVTVTVQ